MRRESLRIESACENAQGEFAHGKEAVRSVLERRGNERESVHERRAGIGAESTTSQPDFQWSAGALKSEACGVEEDAP